MAQEVILYSCWAHPFCRSVEIALKLKGVSFTLIREDLFNPSPQLRKVSPVFQFPPVLVHNGHVICDAAVIMEYIDDETWARTKPIDSLFPKDPKDRATARFLIKFIQFKCMPAVMRACWGRAPEVGLQMAIRNAKNCLKTLENELNGKN